uniref:Uncharacterized protein n=1 Tax=Chromera velia CCMP2878 TaxID=1169474 RepID=A0A0G4HUZ6_9ALVE|eukprot:Cvel_32079.t1-p1 / transcript=Cvel_32079.t1 / gene=Cvel_32079 / organism=Chromera_velia_CCMP2878 / gene_product=hypothetical protein / transcript_product=hypothetical protein / location=Cvel_scaffold4904:5303-7190(-) / protein_length=295 / sequence_SO=supercontig / SO=protein_coding / is_pseudo=false
MTRELWDDEGLLAMAGRRLGLGSFRDALLRQCVPFLLKKADTDPPSLFSLTMSPNDGDLLGSSSEASGATGNSREKEKTGEGGDKAEGVGLESLMMSQQQQAITLTDTAAGGGLGESSAEALSTVAALLRLPPDLTDDLFRLLLANLVKILQAAHKKNVGMITSRQQQQKGRVSSFVPVSPMASSSTRPAIFALSPSMEHPHMAAEGLIPSRPFGSDISVSPLPLETDDMRAGEGVFSDAVLESLPDCYECAGLLVPRMADPHPDVATAAVGAAHDLLAAFPPTAAAAASMRAPQ